MSNDRQPYPDPAGSKPGGPSERSRGVRTDAWSKHTDRTTSEPTMVRPTPSASSGERAVTDLPWTG